MKDQHDVTGFNNWSCKAGIWHCEPPLEVLSRMLFVRVHVDSADAASGAMQIALGSHVEGRVSGDHAQAVAEQYELEMTTAQRGDVLVLNMMTLHRSLPATPAASRRALRVDFAGFEFPAPLR